MNSRYIRYYATKQQQRYQNSNTLALSYFIPILNKHEKKEFEKTFNTPLKAPNF